MTAFINALIDLALKMVDAIMDQSTQLPIEDALAARQRLHDGMVSRAKRIADSQAADWEAVPR